MINKKEMEKFIDIIKYQRKDPNKVIGEWIKRYNIKYNDDYEKSIEQFWETIVNDNK